MVEFGEYLISFVFWMRRLGYVINCDIWKWAETSWLHEYTWTICSGGTESSLNWHLGGSSHSVYSIRWKRVKQHSYYNSMISHWYSQFTLPAGATSYTGCSRGRCNSFPTCWPTWANLPPLLPIRFKMYSFWKDKKQKLFSEDHTATITILMSVNHYVCIHAVV